MGWVWLKELVSEIETGEEAGKCKAAETGPERKTIH